MKLMMVLSRVPFPLDKGDKLRAYHMLRHLSRGNEIYLFCISEKEIAFDVKEHLLDFCKEVHVFPVSRDASLFNAALGIFSSKPLQAVYFYDKEIHRKIIEHSARITPDSLFFQLARTAEYSKDISHPSKVIDYMDAFSTGYERMARKSGLLKKLLFNLEARRLKKYESEIFQWFNKHVIISEQDRTLIAHDERAKIEVIPNGVDAVYFSPSEHVKKYDLLFHGNMNYLPNIDAALYVAEKILPELRKRGRDVSFLISGASPDRRIVRLAADKRITVTGWLDDVRSSYAASKIFIAPLQMGTGIQNKLLEAMAMGIPCVVSSLAAQALNLRHGEHVLIGNSTEEYAQHIESLYSDEALSHSLVQASLKHIRENFRWEDTVAKLGVLIK